MMRHWEQSYALLSKFVEDMEVVPAGSSRRCLRKLYNPKHHCNRCYDIDIYRRFQDANPSLYGSPDLLDHDEWWRLPSGAFVVTAHPYQTDVRKDLTAYGTTHGIPLEVRPQSESWYVPNQTYLPPVPGRAARGYNLKLTTLKP